MIDGHVTASTHAAYPDRFAHKYTWQKFSKELAELNASSKLYPTRLTQVYLEKVREELAKLHTSSEHCPTTFA